MFKKSLIVAGLFAASISNVAALPYGFYDARSVAMGNVSVATGSVTTAAFSNPAMMSINEQDDTFALLVPAIGFQVVDNGGVIDLVDEFQVLSDQPLTTSSVQRMSDITTELDGDSVIANAAANAAIVYAADSFSIGVSYLGSGQASAGYTEITPGNVAGLVAPDGTINALGYVTQELAVSFSTKMSLMGLDVAIGVTPKSVQADSIVYSQNINIADPDNVVDDAVETDMGSFTTVDAGIAIQLMDSLTVGLVAKNLIEESLTDGVNTFNFDTHLRAGVSYHNSFLTLAADMDLTEIDPVSINDSPSKMMSVGLELDTFDIVQIRAGYQTNMASGATDPDLLSVGLGFWLGFHLDVAAVVAEDSSLGAFVQTGFRF
ncbi:MAG: conjugal transfer protein TraF [Gammaproteobacteria bacterium]|nr:conjugal transfer protein TraF [Gammaproteobacteria bacterium]